MNINRITDRAEGAIGLDPSRAADRSAEAPSPTDRPPGRGWSILFGDEAGIADVSVVAMGRAEAMACARIYGPGWVRLEHGHTVIAIRVDR